MPNDIQKRRQTRVDDAKPPESWVDREVAECEFKDERLGKHESRIPTAYRFFDSDRVSEAEILCGHFQATRDRAAATDGPILVLHDTTEFTYQREDIDAVGKPRINIARGRPDGRPRYYTGCGILMHSSLAVTTGGLPLGLTAIKFWSRKKFKGSDALKRKINPTRVPIEKKESIRWIDNLQQSSALLGDADRCVHIGDRESDIYELFCNAQDAGTQFLLRTLCGSSRWRRRAHDCDGDG